MIFVVILILIISVLLILVVLAQNPKGGGLSSQFGGSGASNIIGVKKTTDLLEKLTWGFAMSILALSMLVNVMASRSSDEQLDSPNLDRATPVEKPLPGFEPSESTDNTNEQQDNE